MPGWKICRFDAGPGGAVGRPAIHRFFSTIPTGGELQRFEVVVTRANGQLAFAGYLRTHEGRRSSTSVEEGRAPYPPFATTPRSG